MVLELKLFESQSSAGFKPPIMVLSNPIVLAVSLIVFRPDAPGIKALHQNQFDCCGERQRVNSSCSNYTHCEPGCYLRVLENNTSVCMQCDPATIEMDNLTACNYTYTMEKTNRTTITTLIPNIGGPGVAASLLLGTLLISLFLILSVASFFYLKRSHRLPSIFYRRNKSFIFQPSETAVMIPGSTSSGRKPRYVRRERPSAISASSGATIPTTATTKVYNV
ncbi:uncharacterized protein C1orf159 homolog [Osmerus mordax]|uniref:uncharacterized protein C1orf159 homolog n=1 Tax=Osmerus mordax TaxID=8014 RepID=UPI00350F40FB